MGKFFRQTSNDSRVIGGGGSSSSSMEALSRRGSNPDTMETSGIASGSIDAAAAFKRESSNPTQQSVDRSKCPTNATGCVCLCSGWAEILIRRPTGNMSWMMRIQNQMSLDAQNSEIPLQNLISQMMPSLSAIYPNCESWTVEPSRNHTVKTSSLTEISQIQGDSSSSLSAATPTQTRCNTRADSNPTPETSTSDLFRTASGSSEHLRAGPEQTHSITFSPTATTPLPSEDKSAATLLSGPIDIPKSAHAYKIPSGSFSDVEPELDDEESTDIAFEENDSRSRNPVRRVNSSPEMSSNYRHPFVAQKASAAAPSSTGALSGTSVSTNETDIGRRSELRSKPALPGIRAPEGSRPDDDTTISAGALTTTAATTTATTSSAATDADQQQKKKNFSKERVNCEAIPEEMTDSTPPNQHPNAIERQHSNEEKMKSSRPAVSSYASFPSIDTQLPEKPPGRNWRAMTMQATSIPINVANADSSTQYASNRRNNTALAAAASSAAAMGVPLSPRLSTKGGGLSLLSSGTGANAASDFPRGRSKTISVVRERGGGGGGGSGNNESDTRPLSRWTFKGSEYARACTSESISNVTYLSVCFFAYFQIVLASVRARCFCNCSTVAQ